MDDDRADEPGPPPGPTSGDLDTREVHRGAHVIRDTPKVLWRTVVKSWDDSIVGQSAQTAFWQTLSLPPLLLALMGLIGYIGGWFGPDTLDVIQGKILSFGNTVFSQSVVDEIIAPTVVDVLSQGRGEVASVGFVIALWAGSSAMSAYVDSIVRAHDQHTVRNPVVQRFFALGLYLAFLVLAVFTLPLVAVGPNLIRRHIPKSWDPVVGHIVDLGYFPFVIAMLVGGLALLYRVALPHPMPWHRHVLGALLAAFIFLVASTGLRIYLGWIATRGYSYGALATPIAFLLFSFFLGFAVMVGAELNAAIGERWPARQTHSEQWRTWVAEQVSGSGLDSAGRAAAHQLKRVASGPITRPVRRRHTPDVDAAPPALPAPASRPALPAPRTHPALPPPEHRPTHSAARPPARPPHQPQSPPGPR